MECAPNEKSLNIISNALKLTGRRTEREQSLKELLSELRDCYNRPLTQSTQELLFDLLTMRDWQVYINEFELADGSLASDLNIIKAPMWSNDWEVGAILTRRESFHTLTQNQRRACKSVFKHHARHKVAHLRGRPNYHYTQLAERLIGILEDAYGAPLPWSFDPTEMRYNGKYLDVLDTALSIHLFITYETRKPCLTYLGDLIKRRKEG